MAKGKLLSCRNRLLKQDMQFQIKLSEALWAGASYGVGPESVNRRT